MSLQLLNEINNNYHVALAVHRELADVFWFISMRGYAMWHEYQYMDESVIQRNLKEYMTETYHTFIADELPKGANISTPLLRDKNRKFLKMEDSWEIIQKSFNAYLDFEENNLQKYQRIASEILSNGETSTFNYVSGIIKDVKAELVFVTNKIIELSAHNWDMPQIIAEQADYYERYEYLIKQLLGKSEKYHHHNSALDAHAKALYEKAPD